MRDETSTGFLLGIISALGVVITTDTRTCFQRAKGNGVSLLLRPTLPQLSSLLRVSR